MKPTAKRLPDTVDVNLSDFVKNSPMFNGGLKLAASELIARAIEKQSKNRYLKPTPIYLEGAGTEAVIAEGLGDEGQPLGTPLTGIDAIERIPRQVEGTQRGPEQLVALQTGGSSGGGFNGGGGGGFNGGGGGGFNGGGDGDGRPPRPPLQDVPGAPNSGTVVLNAANVAPARGFSEKFNVTPPPPGATTVTAFFPVGFTGDKEAIMAPRIGTSPESVKLGEKQEGTLMQAARLQSGDFTFLVFQEAKIKSNPTFAIDPSQGATEIELRLSTQDIPSDLLTNGEFVQAFEPPPPFSNPPNTNPNRTFLGYTLSEQGLIPRPSQTE